MLGDDGDTAGCTLLVAPSSGHLAELHLLRERMAGLGPVEWVTADTDRARDLLAGETVHLVPEIAPRDLRGALSTMPSAHRLMTGRRVRRVVATGTGLAVPYLLTARRLGLPAHFVESAAHVARPSLTGSMASRIPGVHLYAQHVWREPGWSLRGSVFDGFLAAPVLPPTRLDRIVVTLGTHAGHGFRAAAAELTGALRQVAGASADVLWHTGDTDVSGLGIDARPHVPFEELRQAVAAADLVISDAGVGSAMLGLAAGKVAVVLPRRRHRGEHTDDQQVELARLLAGRGLVEHVEVDEITPARLTAGMGRTVLQTGAGQVDFHLTAEPQRSSRSTRRTRIATPSPVVALQHRPENAGVPVLAVSRSETASVAADLAERAGRVTVRVPTQRRPRLRVLPGGLTEETGSDLVRS